MAKKERSAEVMAEDMAQQDRIERAALAFIESFLKGGGAIEIRPLAPAENVATQVGAISILHGFRITLAK